MGSRSDFVRTWLTEAPMGTGPINTYPALAYTIKELIESGYKPVKVGDLNKLTVEDVIFYWYGTEEHIELGTELHVKPQALVVSVTGKDPKLKGKKPYASELYTAILKDADKSIRFMSDEQLSDEGYSIWKKLLKLGHKVTVYDFNNPGRSMKSFSSEVELEEFFKHGDPEYKRYQYVLSEDLHKLGVVRMRFNLRRHRELTGLSLMDHGDVLVD